MITTVIPTFIGDEGDLLRLQRALDSITIQKKHPSEVLISDDTKDEINIGKLRALLSQSQLPINYVSHTLPSNASMNTNFGILNAKHDIVHILHQDDWLINSDYYSIITDAIENHGFNWVLATGITDGRLNAPTFDRTLLFGFNSIGGPSALSLRKDHWIPLDGNFLLLPDVVQFTQMYKRYGDPYITPEPCIEYGTGLHKMTHRISNDEISQDIFQLYSKKITSEFPFLEFLLGVKYWGDFLKLVCETIISSKNLTFKLRLQARLIRIICKIFIKLIEVKSLISYAKPKFHTRNHL